MTEPDYESSGMDEFFGPTSHNPSPLSLFEEEQVSGESLDRVLANHLLTPFGRCACGSGDGVWGIDEDAPWREHVAEVWRDALTVRSVEELDALPEESVVRDAADGTLWVRNNERWVWVFGPYYHFGHERQPLQHSAALVLFRPDWETP